MSCKAAAGTLVCAILAGSTTLDAQARFTALAREAVPAVPNLQIVTIRDVVQDACYLLFVIEPAQPRQHRFDAQLSDVERAAAWRDRRLAELSDGYIQSFGSQFAGTPAPNVLQYGWEGQKVLNAFDLVVRDYALAWLEDQLDRIAAEPRFSVSGPAPCNAPPAAPRRTQ